MRYWAAMQDVGGMNAIVPIIKYGSPFGCKFELFPSGKSFDLLPNQLSVGNDFRSFEKRDAENIVRLAAKNKTLPKALITSMCSEVGREMTPLLKSMSVPVFVVQDFWGMRLRTDWLDSKYHPDFMCVMDRVDKEIVQKAWPNFNSDRIVPTGSPAFDTTATYNVAEGQKRFHESLPLEQDWPVVLYCVDYLAGSAQGLRDLVEALNCIGRSVYFIPRFHPDFKNRAPKGEPEECDEILLNFKAGKIITDTNNLSLLDIISGATVTVGTWTTVLITVAHMRRQAISVMYPNLGQAQFRELVSKGEFYYPLVELGAAAHATNNQELAKTLEKALDNKLDLYKAQTLAFQPDGRSAHRVVKLLTSI